MNGIGTRIQQLRRKLGFTQEELAQRLGVTNKTVSKWECGVTAPDLYLIVPLARIFEVSTDALLGKETIPAENAREKYDHAYARYKDGANPGEGYWWARESKGTREEREFLPQESYKLVGQCIHMKMFGNNSGCL